MGAHTRKSRPLSIRKLSQGGSDKFTGEPGRPRQARSSRDGIPRILLGRNLILNAI